MVSGALMRETAQKIGRRLTSEERGMVTALADYRKMNQVRARVDALVSDPATAASLKPWYRQFCKRPCFHDEYLQTFNRPNVALVDTQGHGVERLTQNAVVANGREYPVDCLIFATGFEVGTSYTRRAGYDITGRNGVTLSEHWGEGLRTLHGLTAHGFPNCFFLGFTQTAITISVPQALGEQARHVAYMVSAAKAGGHEVLEPTAEAEDDYVQEVHRLARVGERFYRECTPGYYNSEGAAGNRNGFFSDMYGGGPLRFFDLLQAWRANGRLEGLDLR
jgi:cyclohexanone monooxygenase